MKSDVLTSLSSARALGWGGFYTLVLLAWTGIFIMTAHLPGGLLSNLSQPGFWSALCTSAAEANPLALFAMWALMSAAMMAPTLVPALSRATWCSPASSSALRTAPSAIGERQIFPRQTINSDFMGEREPVDIHW